MNRSLSIDESYATPFYSIYMNDECPEKEAPWSHAERVSLTDHLEFIKWDGSNRDGSNAMNHMRALKWHFLIQAWWLQSPGTSFGTFYHGRKGPGQHLCHWHAHKDHQESIGCLHLASAGTMSSCHVEPAHC